MLEIFNDTEEEKEVIDDAYPHASSDYIEPSFVPKEVLQYLELVNNLVCEFEAEKGLVKGVHDDV